MLNYIRAELYKLFHRQYFYITIAVGMVLSGGLVWAWWYTNSFGNRIDFSSAVSILTVMLGVGLYSTVVVGDMVFSEQYKNNTLKNEVSYGTPRVRIYLGKLIVQCIAAVVICLVWITFYVGACWLVLPRGEGVADTMQLLGYCLLCVAPLWFGAQALTNAIYFNVKNSTIAAMMIAGFLAVGHQVLELLGMLVNDVFMKVYQVMLPVPIEIITRQTVGDWSFAGFCLAVGVGWFVLSTVLGLLAFQKKEIN